MKYLWAAYKLGTFGKAENVSRETFNGMVSAQTLLSDFTWILVGKTDKGHIPVGMFQGIFVGPMIFIGDANWFPWASDRNKLETTVNALNELRKDYVVMLHNHMDDKRFYEQVARYGVIRRVGRIMDVYEDCPAQVWQTRRR